MKNMQAFKELLIVTKVKDVKWSKYLKMLFLNFIVKCILIF